MLWSLYGDILEKRGDSFLRVVQVIGPAGTGKTSTLRLFYLLLFRRTWHSSGSIRLGSES